jgi:general secretion pathway protein G
MQGLSTSAPAARGVTLLELMLALALVGLLAVVAVPGYSAFIDRTRNNRAIGEVSVLSAQLYRWQTNHGRFPATLAEAGLDGALDPWGEPYEYLDVGGANKGKVRRDKNLNPLNTDFDLYSKGKDLRSATALTAKDSRDDVVRANNGAFIGLGKDY